MRFDSTSFPLATSNAEISMSLEQWLLHSNPSTNFGSLVIFPCMTCNKIYDLRYEIERRFQLDTIIAEYFVTGKLQLPDCFLQLTPPSRQLFLLQGRALQLASPFHKLKQKQQQTLHWFCNCRRKLLLPPSEVVAEYPRLRGDSRMGELYSCLAGLGELFR